MERKFEPKRRLNPVAVAARSRRIFARRRLGWTYQEIARAEGLTAERIGQIVRQGLDGSANAVDGSSGDCPTAPARFAERQTAASREVENLKAIDLAIKIMDRLERRRPAAAFEPYGPKAHERLCAGLDRAARKLFEVDAAQEPSLATRK